MNTKIIKTETSLHLNLEGFILIFYFSLCFILFYIYIIFSFIYLFFIFILIFILFIFYFQSSLCLIPVKLTVG
jgi:Flp pilus assembly protein TadB